MSYISHLWITKCRNIESLEVDLVPRPGEDREFRHLILTGPNGSGKTGVLEALGWVLDKLTRRARSSSSHIRQSLGKRPEIEEGAARVRFTSRVFAVEESFLQGSWLAFYRPATPVTNINSVQSPTTQSNEPVFAHQPLIVGLQQFLVNKKTEQAFAHADGDEAAADQIEAWFAAVLDQLRQLFDEPELTWRFDRRSYSFIFRSKSGHEFNLQELASGYSAVLSIFGDLLMRIDRCQARLGDQTAEPKGIVVIDEIDAHLHLELQEKILPLLTTFFPSLQFIVATHSPAVIASIDGAEIVDLAEPRTQRPSEELRGVPYGAIMTSHFGIESDYDLESTAELARLRALVQKQGRTQAEEAEMNELADTLRGRSDNLSLEVWHLMGQ